MNRIAVLGPGAVGGLISALLWREGFEVVCVARERTAELIDAEGIRVESTGYGEFVARPRAVSELDYEPDVLVIATKAVSLASALQRIPPACVKRSILVPFLNGIEHIAALRSEFGGCLAPGAISVESKRLTTNHLAYLSPSCKVRLASADFDSSRLHAIAGPLNSAGIDSEILDSEEDVLWGKLVRLNALACATSASGKAIGYIRGDPYWYGKLKACLTEGAEVAQAYGVSKRLEEDLAVIARFPDNFTTSMQRDIAAGRVPELDAIAGAVLRAGSVHGIECPTTRELMNIIYLKMRDNAGRDGVDR